VRRVLIAVILVIGSLPGLGGSAGAETEDQGVGYSASSTAAPVLAAPPAGTRIATTQLVAIIDMSVLSPPSPDPSGIAWMQSEFLVSDSEVNETPLFTGSNLFSLSPPGALLGSGSTLPYSAEPTGLGYDPDGNRLFVSDDDRREIFEVRPGSDGQFGSSDDVVTSFDTAVFGSNDPEGVEFDPVSGDVFVLDGRENKVFRVDAGPNGLFDGVSNDDVVTSFGLASVGSVDPEGIAIDPTRGVLAIVDQGTKLVYEVKLNGHLVRVIDIAPAFPYAVSGIALAPGSLVFAETNLFLVDRGRDESVHPDQNDGKVVELRVIAPPWDRFLDDNDSVHEADINAIAAAGITFGCNPPGNTFYCPGQSVTRAQMASFLQRGFDLSPSSTDWFGDDSGSVHEANINAIAAAEITFGCNPPVNDRFCPDSPVTREQLASFLVRALKLAPVSVDRFVDDNQSVHEADINAIAAAGITLGCNPPVNDRFCPRSPVTREQMASFLVRALDLEPLPIP